MKIVHYTPAIRLEEGGVVRAVLDLATRLADRGHAITVATSDVRDVPVSWAGDRQPSVMPWPTPSLPGRLFGPRQLHHIEVQLRSFDVLHLHAVWVPSNHQLAKIARKLGIPYVVSIHGMLDEWSMSQRNWKKRSFLGAGGYVLLDGASAIHCTARGELDQAQRWFPEGRGWVAPLPMDLEPFAEPTGPGAARAAFPLLDADGPSVLFLSRLHYKKNLEGLLRACALLRDRGQPCNLLVAGKGDPEYEASLRALTSELGLEDRTAFLGMVVDTDKLSLYEAADLFVLPTQQENFGFVLYESLASGTPLVTTRGTDTWPEIEASGGGVIADPDPDRLADTMAGLLADPDRLRRMGRAGRAFVFTELGDDRVMERYEEMYAGACS